MQSALVQSPVLICDLNPAGLSRRLRPTKLRPTQAFPRAHAKCRSLRMPRLRLAVKKSFMSGDSAAKPPGAPISPRLQLISRSRLKDEANSSHSCTRFSLSFQSNLCSTTAPSAWERVRSKRRRSQASLRLRFSGVSLAHSPSNPITSVHTHQDGNVDRHPLARRRIRRRTRPRPLLHRPYARHNKNPNALHQVQGDELGRVLLRQSLS